MDYEKRTEKLNIATGILKRATIFILALAFLFVASTVYDMFAFTGQGLGGEAFPGFDELFKRNPDTVAWIKMDGTHINHPVVQAKDNFEYINKSFDGEFYQGGAIFLDCDNAKDFSERYVIIHGHHMSRGAMFSDMAAYLDESFFEDNKTGELVTPNALYALTVCGVKTADAYEGELYYVGPEAGRPLHLMDDCMYKRDVPFNEDDKLVMLSTCAGDMTSKRVVLFCRAQKLDAIYTAK